MVSLSFDISGRDVIRPCEGGPGRAIPWAVKKQVPHPIEITKPRPRLTDLLSAKESKPFAIEESITIPVSLPRLNKAKQRIHNWPADNDKDNDDQQGISFQKIHDDENNDWSIYCECVQS